MEGTSAATLVEEVYRTYRIDDRGPMLALLFRVTDRKTSVANASPPGRPCSAKCLISRPVPQRRGPPGVTELPIP